jgi:hypothetical protein
MVNRSLNQNYAQHIEFTMRHISQRPASIPPYQAHNAHIHILNSDSFGLHARTPRLLFSQTTLRSMSSQPPHRRIRSRESVDFVGLVVLLIEEVSGFILFAGACRPYGCR